MYAKKFLKTSSTSGAHGRPAVPRGLAQRRGLILSKEHHDIRHASPYDIYYCITAGFWNPLLNRTQFFQWTEKPLRRSIPGMDPRLRVEREESLND
jgi:Lipid desaturase domain